MREVFVLLAMIFLHIVDDYYLQGWLASGKQKRWWGSQPNYSSKYKHDYIAALFMHSFSWSFMTMLPIFVMDSLVLTPLHVIVFLINIAIHGFVDDLKANKLRINLVVDQSIHIVQVILTFCIFTNNVLR